jgi:hypothetical protein
MTIGAFCHSYQRVSRSPKLGSIRCLPCSCPAPLCLPPPSCLRHPFPLASAPSQDLHPGPNHTNRLALEIFALRLLLPSSLSRRLRSCSSSLPATANTSRPAFDRQYRSPYSSCLNYTSLPESDSAVDEPHLRRPNPKYRSRLPIDLPVPPFNVTSPPRQYRIARGNPIALKPPSKAGPPPKLPELPVSSLRSSRDWHGSWNHVLGQKGIRLRIQAQ